MRREKSKRLKNRIGSMCRLHRLSIGRTQEDVAKATGYSAENVSAFENGRNANYVILMWYIDNGLDIGGSNA